MKNLMKSLALLPAVTLLSVSALADTTTLSCVRTGCTAVQPNGGNGAQAVCDTFPGPFEFKLSGKGQVPFQMRAKVTINQVDGTPWSFAGRYSLGIDNELNLWSKDPQNSFQAYVSPEMKGTIMIHNNKGVLMYVTMDITCSEK